MCGPSNEASYSRNGTALAKAPAKVQAPVATYVTSADIIRDLEEVFTGFGISEKAHKEAFLAAAQDVLGSIHRGVNIIGVVVPDIQEAIQEAHAVSLLAELTDAFAAAVGVNAGYPGAPDLEFAVSPDGNIVEPSALDLDNPNGKYVRVGTSEAGGGTMSQVVLRGSADHQRFLDRDSQPAFLSRTNALIDRLTGSTGQLN